MRTIDETCMSCKPKDVSHLICSAYKVLVWYFTHDYLCPPVDPLKGNASSTSVDENVLPDFVSARIEDLCVRRLRSCFFNVLPR